MSKGKRFILFLSILSFFLLPSCNPEAHWETDNVQISISVQTVSAGFIECAFSADKDAYYLIACEPVREDYDPLEHPKQFMMMALDSANTEYINWRHELLKDGVFTVAPFASHSLQYGPINHFFTGLIPDSEYWIYAFVVNPETLKPAGKLFLEQLKTTENSIVDVHFEYRVRGNWDYIYPLDTTGKIHSHFPYIATTRDSLDLDTVAPGVTPQDYFRQWMIERFVEPKRATVFYGVQAMYNDGVSTSLQFEPGHTYYTAIGGFDGSFKQNTLYKFHWEGEKTEIYFTDEDNIAGSW